MDVLFDMVGFHDDIRVFFLDPIGNALGEEHGAVLSSCTAEGDHEMVEVALKVVVDALSYDPFDMVEEEVGLWLFIQIFSHFPITASLGLELRFASRIRQGAAVENETTSIAAEIVRIAFFEREAVDGNGELGVENGKRRTENGFILWKQGDHLGEDALEFGIALERVGGRPCRQLFQGKRNAFDEVGLFLDETSKTVCAEHLHQSKIHKVGVVTVEIDTVRV